MHNLFVTDWALHAYNYKVSLPAQIPAGRHAAQTSI